MYEPRVRLEQQKSVRNRLFSNEISIRRNLNVNLRLHKPIVITFHLFGVQFEDIDSLVIVRQSLFVLDK